MAATPAVESDVIQRILRGAWSGLPALLCASAVVCTALTVTVLVAPGVTPVSVLVAALLAGPASAALAATVNRLAFHGEATIRGWWEALRRLWLFGIGQCLVAAVPAAALLAALHLWTRTAWALPSLIVSGSGTVLVLLGLPAALSLGAARPRLRGRMLWICAIHLVARWPMRFLAAPVLACLGVWAAASWTASLLPLIPGPVAIVAGAAVWTSVTSLRSQLVSGVH